MFFLNVYFLSLRSDNNHMFFLVVYAFISLFPLELVILYKFRDYVFLLIYRVPFSIIKRNCVFLNFLFCSVNFLIILVPLVCCF